MHASETLMFLIVILVVARLGGELAERVGQPAVLGEILGGIMLGVIPLFHGAVEDRAILFISEIGVILLLFEVGLDSEIKDFLKVGVPAALVAIIGVILPLAGGTGVSALFGLNLHQSIFIGATLTATSVGITARVMKDLRQSQSKEAKIIVGAAVVDDILGLLVLAIVLGIVAPKSSHQNPFTAIVVAVAFVAAAIIIGLKAAPWLISLTGRMRGRGVLIVAAFTFCLLLSYLSSLAGLAPIIGAFAAGLVLASTESRSRISDKMQPVADIFVPVFFVVVGLHVDISYLAKGSILLLALVLLAVAVVAKTAAGLGALGQKADALLVGIGMVPRGEVGLIFASVGLANGVFSVSVYGAMVIVVLLTTLVTPPWLKRRLASRRR